MEITLNQINRFYASEYPDGKFEIIAISPVHGENRTFNYCVSRNGKHGELLENFKSVIEYAALTYHSNRTNSIFEWAMLLNVTDEQIAEATAYIATF